MKSNINIVYSWFTALSDGEKENLRSNNVKALNTFRKVFADPSITDKVVDLLLNEPSDIEVKKASIENEIYEKQCLIKDAQKAIDDLENELDVVEMYGTEKVKRNSNPSAILDGIKRIYEEKAKAIKIEKAKEKALAKAKIAIENSLVQDDIQEEPVSGVQEVVEKVTTKRGGKKTS